MSSRRGAARWSRARCGSNRAPSYEPSEASSPDASPAAGAFGFAAAFGLASGLSFAAAFGAALSLAGAFSLGGVLVAVACGSSAFDDDAPALAFAALPLL